MKMTDTTRYYWPHTYFNATGCVYILDIQEEAGYFPAQMCQDKWWLGRDHAWARMKEPFLSNLHVCRGASPDWVAPFPVTCYREVSPLHHTIACFHSARSQRGAGRVGSIHRHNNMLMYQCFANSNYHKHFSICTGHSLFAICMTLLACNVLLVSIAPSLW